MAKVKIQGHASGSGVLTVTAPNTSTDRTITLPDATGTLLNSDGSGANLTGLPNGSQLDHSGTKKIEAVSTGAQIQNRLEVITPNDSSTHLVQRLGSTDGSYGYVDLELVSPNSTAASLPRLDVQIGNSTVASFIRGGGIALGGTGAANTLDDYEEGTWTPQVKIDGSTTGITHDAQGGTYTKIGNTVILHAVLSLSSKGSETGAVTFANFPFTVENWTATSSLDGGSICFGFYSGTTGISRLGGIAVGGTSTANLYRQASDQSQLNDTMWETKIVNGFSTRWTLIYQTSA